MACPLLHRPDRQVKAGRKPNRNRGNQLLTQTVSIGDKMPGAKQIAYALQSTYKADSPLLPSGLLGPVKVVVESVEASSDSH
jgi:hypothetical protein